MPSPFKIFALSRFYFPQKGFIFGIFFLLFKIFGRENHLPPARDF
jgi:hypothetical protein